MAFPVVQTTAESATTVAASNHTINLPASIANGDRLLWIGGKGSQVATMDTPTGWTRIIDENIANGVFMYARDADGTEGASMAVTSSGATVKQASIVYRVSGAEAVVTQLPEISTVATGTGTTPDPGSVSVTGGPKDILAIAMFNLAGEEVDDDTWCNSAPTNYAGLLQKTSGTGGTNTSNELATAHRQLNAASEDPGSFNVDVSFAWRAYTIAIHPAGAAAAASDAPRRRLPFHLLTR
jgi:hypothetical protein